LLARGTGTRFGARDPRGKKNGGGGQGGGTNPWLGVREKTRVLAREKRGKGGDWGAGRRGGFRGGSPHPPRQTKGEKGATWANSFPPQKKRGARGAKKLPVPKRGRGKTTGCGQFFPKKLPGISFREVGGDPGFWPKCKTKERVARGGRAFWGNPRGGGGGETSVRKKARRFSTGRVQANGDFRGGRAPSRITPATASDLRTPARGRAFAADS